MFRLLNPFHTENVYCSNPVNEILISEENVKYYDKDGFELTLLEQEYYRANGFERHISPCLNHNCWQAPWFELINNTGFILDHSLVLHRCSFKDSARKQLENNLSKIPRLSYLLKCPSKWGIDFSLDYVDDNGKLTEVLHIEIDTKNYHEFLQQKEEFENFVLTTDWKHFYMFLDLHRNNWEHLVGFEQNDWKANQLGFKKAETTLKSI